MTTLVRVEKVPPAARTSFTGTTFANLADDLTGPGRTPYNTILFEPLDQTKINEIIAYATLGMSKISVHPDLIPGLLYKWHIWLTRMNNWMKDHKDSYQKSLVLPDVQLPVTLYFLSSIPTDDIARQVSAATTAALGPLLPYDKHTLLNALSKGIGASTDTTEGTLEDISVYSKYIINVNKLAMNAIDPLQKKGTMKQTSVVPQKDHTSPHSAIMPLPPVVSVSHGGHTQSGGFVGVVVGSEAADNSFPGKAGVQHLVESFTGAAGTSTDGTDTTTSAGDFLSSIPMWMWVVLLGLAFYFFTQTSSAGSDASSPSSATSVRTLIGGRTSALPPNWASPAATRNILDFKSSGFHRY